MGYSQATVGHRTPPGVRARVSWEVTTIVRRLRLALATALSAALLVAAPAGAAPPTSAMSDAPAPRATVDRAYALVQLKGAPLATAARTRPAPGRKIDFNAAAVKAYRAQLAAQRNEFRAWLSKAAPKAQITRGFDLSLNAVSVRLNGTTLATIRTSPLVVRAQYQGLYYPTAHGDPDLSIIRAAQAWAAAGVAGADAGEGVKVGVVDSGIDVGHPCFSDAGYAARTQRGDTRFTNNKVIVARVFNNKTPSRAHTPEAIDDHGTHVAGTIACNLHTDASVSGVAIPYDISGVAPAALLGNYNVFPGTVASARSEDILNALDAAYRDGMDVVNMSLGGGASGIQDLLTMAVDNLDRAGLVFAISAGNEGPGPRTVGSPGSAARALTAGASTVPHFVGAPLSVGGGTYGVAAGDFATVTSNLTAPLGVVTGGTSATGGLNTACAALPAGSLSGKIALISRGGCTFSQKIRSAQNAGAVAAIVVNNVAGDPTAMGLGGIPNEPTIPAYMAALGDRAALMAANGQSATIGVNLAYFSTPNVDIMAGFSSQGPTDVDFRVKPDLVAPGVNVLSSVPQRYCDAGTDCFAFFQGTSMASPHLAGAAAIVLQANPGWAPWQVRSAVTNTAKRGVLKVFTDGTTVATDVNVTGAGRLDLEAAVQAEALLDPVSLSFGAVPAGSGVTRSLSVRIQNVSGSAATFGVAISGSPSGLTLSTSASSVTLAAGASATVTVRAVFSKSASRGGKQAWLELTDGSGHVAHAVVYALVK